MSRRILHPNPDDEASVRSSRVPAGKSTAIGCISGLLKPTSGRITVLGHDVVRDSVEGATRKLQGSHAAAGRRGSRTPRPLRE